MILKFSQPAAVAASFCALLLVTSSTPLRAQTPKPSPSPAVKPKLGYIRFWNMLPLEGSTFELVQDGTPPPGRVLQTASPANFSAGYIPLPPGAYTLKVCRPGEHDKPIKSFAVPVRHNSYITILTTQPPGAAIKAELLDDTPDPFKPPVNRLTVRQFVPDIHVVATAAGTKRTEALDYGATQTLEGLPGGLVQLNTRATLTGGATKTWNTEADFRTSHHASLLVLSDPYGRIRPRVSVDGPSPAAEAEAAEEAAAAAAVAPSPTPSTP